MRFPRFASAALLTTTSALAFTACGDSQPEEFEPATLQEPIVGGEPDDGANAHPNVVAISVGGGLCSGTLIASNLVATAWHCVARNLSNGIGCQPEGISLNSPHVGNDRSASSMEIFTGVSPNIFSGTPVAIGSQILHADDDEGNLCNKDLAFIVLDRDVNGITPATVRLDYPPQPNEKVTAVGYGNRSDSPFGPTGDRYRRENVTIQSSGIDYNFLTSSKEFVLTPSICGGDSGGPAFSESTGALLGVTSRGAEPCSTSNGIMTSLAGHKSLVEAAFAAAGKTPIVDSSADPGPFNTGKTGQPCDSGWECQSGVCGDGYAGSGKQCTELCEFFTCPIGTFCVDGSFTIRGAGTNPAKICAAIPNDGSCFGCRANTCNSRTQECLDDDGCAAIQSCVDGCSDATCVDNCIASNPGGAAAYEALQTCSCDFGCDQACADDCSVEMGTGGTGAAGGTGGTGNAGSGNAGSGNAGSGNAGNGGSGNAGSSGGGQGGSDTSGGTAGTGGTEQGEPATSGSDSGDSGGCSVASHTGSSGSGEGWLALGLLGLGLLRRRHDR